MQQARDINLYVSMSSSITSYEIPYLYMLHYLILYDIHPSLQVVHEFLNLIQLAK
jgi:hypothetical protein